MHGRQDVGGREVDAPGKALVDGWKLVKEE
jgi:hypothetical protein